MPLLQGCLAVAELPPSYRPLLRIHSDRSHIADNYPIPLLQMFHLIGVKEKSAQFANG